MVALLGCAKVPCASCPYRRDVPSGVWHPSEYKKLPDYDGDFLEQLNTGAKAAFHCHQQNGKLCAGWVGAHGAINLVSLRLIDNVDPALLAYRSPVPLFKTGGEAARHGMKHVRRPTKEAKGVIDKVLKLQARRRWKTKKSS